MNSLRGDLIDLKAEYVLIRTHQRGTLQKAMGSSLYVFTVRKGSHIEGYPDSVLVEPKDILISQPEKMGRLYAVPEGHEINIAILATNSMLGGKFELEILHNGSGLFFLRAAIPGAGKWQYNDEGVTLSEVRAYIDSMRSTIELLQHLDLIKTQGTREET